MTVDIEKLETLAKAASQGSWNQDGFDVQNDDIKDYRVSRCNLLADAKFIAAANPAAVLELISSGKQQTQQFKEWQASHHANYCNVADERDQLRAEVAGLKTGYEAYERVNAELKAENEVLRKNAVKWEIVKRAGDQLLADEGRAAIWSACSRILISVASELNSGRSVVTEEGVTNGGVEIGDWRVTVERIAVALGQGEQS